MVRRNRRTGRRSQRNTRRGGRGLLNARDKIVRTVTYSGTIAANSTIALNLTITQDGPQRVVAGAIRAVANTVSKMQFAVRGEGLEKQIPSRVLLCSSVPTNTIIRVPVGEGYTTYEKGSTCHVAWVTNIGTGAIEYVANIHVITLSDLEAVTFNNVGLTLAALPDAETTND